MLCGGLFPHHNGGKKSSICFQSLLGGEDLSRLRVSEGVTLADHVAFVIGQ